MATKVLYLAAECKPFSKAGGIGDVAGELPPALRAAGVDIEVVTPLYESVPRKLIGEAVGSFQIAFNGRIETVRWSEADLDGVKVHLLGNSRFFEGRYGSVYVHSPTAPFEDDIQRFSFFSKASLELVKRLQPDIVHINDWVLGYLFGWMKLENLPQKRVLTIHNIGYQGNLWKPRIEGTEISSLMHSPETAAAFEDPRTEWNSVNALRLAIELADFITTVSPSYAREIQVPEAPESYFEGGKGLQSVLQSAQARHCLVGILNGFNYGFQPTLERFNETLERKLQAKKELAPYFRYSHRFLLGFVGRAVEQKFKLLTELLDGRSVLEHILELPNVNVAILATGLPDYESFIGNVAIHRYHGAKTFDELLGLTRRENYMCALAFDKNLAKGISLASDGFLMPSLFEPCGITQLEAMNNATPPLVRLTGGLADTVIRYPDEHATGFGFSGISKDDVLRNLIECVHAAACLYEDSPERFMRIQRNAFFRRFSWRNSAQEYVDTVYSTLN
jgi:starch synthase